MHPEVIIHNSVSHDRAVTGFEVDLGLHYDTLLALEPGAVLAGSATTETGIKMFTDIIRSEVASDRHRPGNQPQRCPPGSGQRRHVLPVHLTDSRGLLYCEESATPG